MSKLLITILLSVAISADLFGQAITVNGVSLAEGGGSPSSCNTGTYKTLNAATTNGACIDMTAASFNNGAIWVCDGIDLNQTFKVSFTANFGTDQSTGDGIAFLLQREALPQVIGGRGGGIGYATGDGGGCQSAPCPIDPSVAVEFDTYDGSSFGDNDAACNHMSIQIDGSTAAGATIEGPNCLLPGGVSVVDGLDHDICITWDPGVLEYNVYFDGAQIGSFGGDIRTYFPNPTDVWWGFTAATGGAAQNQSVCNVVMETNIISPSCICNPTMSVTTNSFPSTCNGVDGSFLIGSLEPNTTYDFSYDLDGSTVGPFAITTDAFGNYLLSGLGAGTYTNFTADLLGCVVVSAGPLLLIEPDPPILVITDPPARCEPGSIDLTDASITDGSSGGGILTYWVDATATTSLPDPTSVTTSGTYYIQADNGCTDIQPVNVIINPAPIVNSPLPWEAIICSGGSFSFTPSADIPGTTFSWFTTPSSPNLSGFSSNGNGSINESISNSGNTTETVTYTISSTGPAPTFCAGSTFDYVVTVSPNPADPIVSTGAATCTADGTATIDNYDGTLTYTFTPAGPTVGAGGVISGMTPGTSYDVVADNGSCSSGAATFSVDPQLTVPADPIVSTGAATCTADGTATIDNYDGTLTYTFTPAGPTVGAGGVISGMTPGTSYDVVADDGSCSSGPATFSVDPQLTVPADPIVSTGAATCTADGTATIDNYDGTLTYTFTPAGPTAGASGVISGMTPGTSYDVVADDGSCSSGPATFSVDPQLTVPADPIISTGAATCTADGTATIDNYDGTLTYTFTPAGPTVGAGGAISGLTPGTSYDVVADDGSCSSGAATFSVDPQLTVPADPIVSTGAATCTADGTATIDNYDGTLTYTFTPAGPTVGAGGVISGMTPGTSYDVVADDGSCSSGPATFSVDPQLTVPADPIVSTGAATCTADGTATIDNYDGTLTYTFTPAGPTVGAGGVISGMTPGTSYDVVADNGSCSSGPATFSVDPQLTVPADPIVSTGAATCTADGTATIDNYDGTLTYTFTPAGPTVGAGGVISGMTPGTSYDVVADDGSCSSGPATFSVDPQLTVPADPIVSTGAATCTADGTATIDNYDGTLTYTFTPAGPTVGAGGVISGMTPGTSYDVVADDGSCSSGPATFSVDPQLTVPADPIVSTGAATCTADGTATIDNYDGTLTYTFTPAGPTANVGGVITGIIPGTSYTIVADDGVCSSNASNAFTVDVQLPTPTITLTPNDPSACNGTDGSILVSGVGSGTVTWSGAASGTDNAANLNYTIQNLGAGTYDVFFVDGTTGCQSSTESTLLNNPGAPIVDPINSVNNCGTDYTLGAITGSDLVDPQYYDAPGGPSGGGNIVPVGTTYTAPTDITLYAYDQNGICISEQIFTVLIEELPTVTSVNGGNTYCVGDTPADITADVTGNGPWTIDYTVDGVAQIASGATSPINLGNAPGVYVVTNITDATCDNTATGTQTIDFYTMPTVSAVNGGADYCPGDVISDITADVTGNGPWTIDFTLDGIAQSVSGATSPINLGNAPGVYVITNITDANCTDIASGTQTINVNPIPTITLTPSDPTVCNGNDGSILVSGTGSGTVTWSGSASGTDNTANLNYNISNLSAGSYDVFFIDGTTGCQSTTESTILNNPSAPVAPIVSTGAPTCTDDGTATIDNYDGTLTYTFTPAGPTVGAGGAISGLIFGTLYTVQADDGNCLSAASSSFSIDAQFPTPTISLTPNDPSVCNGTDGSIFVGGIGSGTVTWSGTASGNDNTAILNYTIPNLGAGSYDVFFIDATTGCQSTTESAELNNPGAPSLDALSSTTACDTYTLPAITGTNLSGNQSYYTESNGAGTPLSEGDVISSTQTIYIYDILGTCADESNFTITIDYTPSLTNPGPQQVCDTFYLPLSISGTNLSGNENYYSDLQSNGGTVITDAITSSQTVYIYDANGNCSNEISFEVTVNPLPSLVSFTGEGTYCEGDDVNNLIVEVSGAPDYTLDYTLNGNPTTISSSNSSIDLGNASGTYVLTALADNACGISLDQTQTITVNPLPSIPTVSEDASYCSNAVAEDLQASGSSGNYSWYSDASLSELIGSNQSYSPDMIMGTTTYYVTATENGCEGLPADVSITFENCEIIIPTAFTPDDDQVNDTWNLGDIDVIYPNNVVSVYNRWGNKIYESDQGAYSQRPWNGTFNEKALPVASYYFIIEFNDNSTQNKTGIVSVIR